MVFNYLSVPFHSALSKQCWNFRFILSALRIPFQYSLLATFFPPVRIFLSIFISSPIVFLLHLLFSNCNRISFTSFSSYRGYWLHLKLRFILCPFSQLASLLVHLPEEFDFFLKWHLFSLNISDYSCLFIVDLTYRCHYLLTDTPEVYNVLSTPRVFNFCLVWGLIFPGGINLYQSMYHLNLISIIAYYGINFLSWLPPILPSFCCPK